MYTLQRKPDIHDMYTFCASPHTPLDGSYGQSPYVANFHAVLTKLDGSDCSQKKGIPDYIPSLSADQSMGPHPVSLSS
jgi:hypothetical protein